MKCNLGQLDFLGCENAIAECGNGFEHGASWLLGEVSGIEAGFEVLKERINALAGVGHLAPGLGFWFGYLILAPGPCHPPHPREKNEGWSGSGRIVLWETSLPWSGWRASPDLRNREPSNAPAGPKRGSGQRMRALSPSWLCVG